MHCVPRREPGNEKRAARNADPCGSPVPGFSCFQRAVKLQWLNSAPRLEFIELLYGPTKFSLGDVTWVAAIFKAGDNGGWSRFVHLYTPLIFAWGRKAGLQDADAADICQDVFRAVSAGIDRFDCDRPASSFRGWLWTITRRTLGRYFGREIQSLNAAGGSAAMMRLSEFPNWIDDDVAPEVDSAESEVIRRAAELLLVPGDFEEHTWRAFWMSAVDEGRPATLPSNWA